MDSKNTNGHTTRGRNLVGGGGGSAQFPKLNRSLYMNLDSAEKPLGMFRQADTSTSSVERKMLNVINPLPVCPGALEG